MERGTEQKSGAESEVSPGSLYSSGLIAAGGVFGLLAIILNLLQDPGVEQAAAALAGERVLFAVAGEDFCLRRKIHAAGVSQSPWLGVVMFLLLASSLFVFARKKLE